MVKNLSAIVGDVGLIPGSGRSPGEGKGYPHLYSCLENSTDRGAWQATARGVAESGTTEQLTLSHFYVPGFYKYSHHIFCNIELNPMGLDKNEF